MIEAPDGTVYDGLYSCDSIPGIAFRVHDVVMETEWWYDDEIGYEVPVESWTGQLEVIAVGDRYIWRIDPDDLTPIASVCSCGQIGCGHEA